MLPFSWIAFALLALALVLFLAPFVARACSSVPSSVRRSGKVNWIPISASLALLLGCWALAWTRLPLMGELQFHTFTPLWLSYIVAANLIVRERNGSCPLFDDTGRYLMLFPASAVLWWCFEYLNRFTENWVYQNISHFSPLTYGIFATLAYSTVLPAIEVSRQLFEGAGWLTSFRHWTRIPLSNAFLYACGFAAAVGLLLLPVFPFELYALMWVSPIFLLAALQRCFEVPGLLDEVHVGNWTSVVAYAVAGVLCGLLWELWNYHSLARWIYAVPYVDALRIFEMPLLGYAGYLPFGILCGMLIRLLNQRAMPPRHVKGSGSQDFIPLLF